MNELSILDWYGLYNESWRQDIVPDAYNHPAKVKRGLIRQIYRHGLERDYWRPGMVILDPFGGVAGTSLDAMLNGLTWIGIELEPRFVTLAQQNIDLWNGRYGPHFPKWGMSDMLDDIEEDKSDN